MAELTIADVQKASKAGARAAIAEEVKKDDSAGGQGHLYKLVRTLVAEALDEAFADGGAFYTGGGPYARLNETVYEQLNKVLDEREGPPEA